MAMELIRARLLAENLDCQIRVDSAGVRANDGDCASLHGVELLAEMNISLTEHRARRLCQNDLEEADLVLVMTAIHRQELYEIAPQAIHKVLLFTELTASGTDEPQQNQSQQQATDIVDPYGEPKEVYRATLLQLTQILDQGWITLRTLLSE